MTPEEKANLKICNTDTTIVVQTSIVPEMTGVQISELLERNTKLEAALDRERAEVDRLRALLAECRKNAPCCDCKGRTCISCRINAALKGKP